MPPYESYNLWPFHATRPARTIEGASQDGHQTTKAREVEFTLAIIFQHVPTNNRADCHSRVGSLSGVARVRGACGRRGLEGEVKEGKCCTRHNRCRSFVVSISSSLLLFLPFVLSRCIVVASKRRRTILLSLRGKSLRDDRKILCAVINPPSPLQHFVEDERIFSVPGTPQQGCLCWSGSWRTGSKGAQSTPSTGRRAGTLQPPIPPLVTLHIIARGSAHTTEDKFLAPCRLR